MGRKILPRLEEEPPLVTLDRLAQGELPPETPTPIADDEAARSMIDLFRDVAFKDGESSENERLLVQEFLHRHRSSRWDEDFITDLLNRFNDSAPPPFNLRNACFTVKNRTTEALRCSFLTTLYRLAYQDGMTLTERQAVDRIGELLNLPNSVIRQISLSSSKGKI